MPFGDKEKKKEYRRKYYLEHRDKEIALAIEWNSNHPMNQWKKLYPKKVKKNSKKLHEKYNAEWNEIFSKIFEERNFTQCFICGKRPIQTHHLNPAIKDFKISEIKKRKCTEERIEKLKVELIKCFPLCVGCHRHIHSEMNKLTKQTQSLAVGNSFFVTSQAFSI